MINARGWVVVLAFTVVALFVGWNAGSFKRDRTWHDDWTRVTVAGNCKGDKLAMETPK